MDYYKCEICNKVLTEEETYTVQKEELLPVCDHYETHRYEERFCNQCHSDVEEAFGYEIEEMDVPELYDIRYQNHYLFIGS